MNSSKFFSARNISFLAILLALVVVLQALGGSINIGLVQLNFTLIPIVLGALLLGPIAGGVLGFACGVVVLIQVIIAPAGFYYIIWTFSPVVTVFTCIVKTTVAGFVAGILFNIVKKKNKHVAVFLASGIVPIINTALFIVGCLCMNSSITAFQGMLDGFGGMNILVFILVGLVTFNFFFEFAINLLVSPALYRVIKIVDKSDDTDEDDEDNSEDTEDSSENEKE